MQPHRYHPDLVALGISTRRAAERHYRAKGWREGRLARRTRVVLRCPLCPNNETSVAMPGPFCSLFKQRVPLTHRYTAGTGLVNQFYCHLAAFSLAAAVGSEVVLPYAAKRDSFGLYFSTVAEQNQVGHGHHTCAVVATAAAAAPRHRRSCCCPAAACAFFCADLACSLQVSWAPAPLETILDVERIMAIWQEKGMAVHKVGLQGRSPRSTDMHIATQVSNQGDCLLPQIPALVGMPDLVNPQQAYPLYDPPGIGRHLVTRISGAFRTASHAVSCDACSPSRLTLAVPFGCC